MKSPIFGKEKLLYFPQKSGIVPIFRKSPSSYISYFCEHTPCIIIKLNLGLKRLRTWQENLQKKTVWTADKTAPLRNLCSPAS